MSYFKPEFVVLPYSRFLILSHYLISSGIPVTVERGESDLVRIPYSDAKRLCFLLNQFGFEASIERPSLFDFYIYGDYYRFYFSTPFELSEASAAAHKLYVENFGLLCKIDFPSQDP